MDAADVLYGVSMGGDGVTKVVSRRLPREAASAEAGPPPFAGIAPEAEAEEAIAEAAPSAKPGSAAAA
jgi:hypothetical protein